MQHHKMIVAGGLSFVVGALAFVLVFSYLAANFDYPSILDGSAAEVLPRLRAGGSIMRAVWAFYAFLPLLLIPGAVGTYFACPSSRGRMTLALVIATLGALAMCLGLMRWPSIHWALAEAYAHLGVEAKSSLAAVVVGLNLYLGNYIGEFLGRNMPCVIFPSRWLVTAQRSAVPKMVRLVRSAVRIAVCRRRVPECRPRSASRCGCQQRSATAMDACPRGVACVVLQYARRSLSQR